MTSLYNCKHSGDQYRITKFTSDLDVEASYLCDLHSCECPAGHRPKCRHREMLPKFIAREAVGTQWFFDFDRGGWVQGWKEEPTAQPLQGQPEPELTIAREITLPADASPNEVAEAFSNLLASAALPIQHIIEPKLYNEQPHEHDDEQLAFYREAARIANEPSPSPTIRRRV